jgi:hypothetical protein
MENQLEKIHFGSKEDQSEKISFYVHSLAKISADSNAKCVMMCPELEQLERKPHTFEKTRFG